MKNEDELSREDKRALLQQDHYEVYTIYTRGLRKEKRLEFLWDEIDRLEKELRHG